MNEKSDMGRLMSTMHGYHEILGWKIGKRKRLLIIMHYIPMKVIAG